MSKATAKENQEIINAIDSNWDFIIAKTYRDDFMVKLHDEYPYYDWKTNKGYPTKKHRAGIAQHGASPYHRMSFTLLPEARQLEIKFEE